MAWGTSLDCRTQAAVRRIMSMLANGLCHRVHLDIRVHEEEL